MSIESFLHEWFGLEGRELGKPERFYTNNPQDLFKLLEANKRFLKPCYMTVQPYSAPDQPCAIERLFWDFDCEEDPLRAWRDALHFCEALKAFYNVEPLIVYSGRKGFHVYVFLKQAVYIGQMSLAFAKQVYEELQTRLLEGLKFATLDPQPMGDIKRLARVPFSLHEETGSLCCPVDLNRKPITPPSLDVYRTLNPELLSPMIKNLRVKEKLASLKHARKTSGNMEKIRPCIQAALRQPLEGRGGHLMRLAVAREFLAAGYTVEEVVPLFQSQPDFNPEKTRYYVEHAQKNPAKPFKCETIRTLGFCLESCRGRLRHG
ncbi:MAG: hypothetical protein QW160_03710 [Candidatus Bathyarchaeia archaeon]